MLQTAIRLLDRRPRRFYERLKAGLNEEKQEASSNEHFYQKHKKQIGSGHKQRRKTVRRNAVFGGSGDRSRSGTSATNDSGQDKHIRRAKGPRHKTRR